MPRTARTYWLALFSVTSWEEFVASGGEVIGFNENKWGIAQTLKPGDRILCYLTKVSAFVAVFEVRGPARQSSKRIWAEGLFPVRVPVVSKSQLPTAHAIQITSLREKLSIFRGLKNANAWSIWVRSAPRKWPTNDGKIIEQQISKRQHGLSEVIVSQGEIKPNSRKRKTSQAKGGSKKTTQRSKTVVGRVLLKTADLAADYHATIGPREAVLSGNRVTGYSVNFPIWGTCQPTKVCASSCYFATGHNAWSHALRRQLRNLQAVEQDPHSFATRVALEYDKLGLSFIRWNGGGDLFPQSIAAVNYLGKIRPDIRIWVVTRIAKYAAEIEHAENVFVHFSLDRSSLNRRRQFEAADKKSTNYFYSYQAERGEMPTPENLNGVSVLFFDDYQPNGDYSWIPQQVVCPLNETNDISNTCENCERCFNGAATQDRLKLGSL